VLQALPVALAVAVVAVWLALVLHRLQPDRPMVEMVD
jgi:hypothetical protein